MRGPLSRVLLRGDVVRQRWSSLRCCSARRYTRAVNEALQQALARHQDDPRLHVDVPATWGAYRGYAEVLSTLEEMRERGARVTTPGRSVQGEPIVRVELGPRTSAASSLVLGGIHAMEWIGVETALTLADALLDAPPSRRVVIYPLMNPDGYKRVETNLRAGRFRFVRANANNVDLNRNWPTFFRPKKPFVQRLLPFLGTPGSHPGSEPEVRTVMDELDASPKQFTRAVSLHSFGGMLLLPHGGKFALPPDIAQLREHARRVNARLSSPYKIRSSSHWVPGQFAHGMEMDDLHARGISPILVECAWGQLSLFKPSTWLHPWRWFNPVDPSKHAVDIGAAIRPFLLEEND